MKLNLKKPLVFFDLETTGVDICKDRIVEICYIKVFPDGSDKEYTRRINPGMHIPEEASAVHGIYDEDVKDAPLFKDVAKEIAADFGLSESNVKMILLRLREKLKQVLEKEGILL